MYWLYYLSATVSLIIAYWINFGGYEDSIPFRYRQYGDLAKPAVVVIPGLDGCTAFFADVLPELTVNFNVILFHIPLKSKNVSNSEYTFDYLTSKLVAVLDELQLDRVSVVGESFGGIIAQHVGFLHPDRVDKLVLLSSLARTELPPEIEWKVRYLLPIVRTVGQLLPSVAQSLFARLHVDDVVEKSEPQYVKDLFVKEASVAHFHSVMARIKLAYHLNIVDQVAGIRAPVLLVYGADDHFTKRDTFALQGHLKNSHVTVKALPGGHLAHITSPKEFSRVVTDFLMEQ